MKTNKSHILLVGFCLLIALFSTGCIGMAMRSIATENVSYQDVSSRAGPIANDKSRVWVYVSGGDPTVWNTMGKLPDITFNKKVYSSSGNCFFYADVPSGTCRVATSVIIKGKHWKPGLNQRQIIFQGGQEYFIKIQSPANGPSLANLVGTLPNPMVGPFPFDLAEKTQALTEMRRMKYFKPKWQNPGKDLDE